jgi:SAM-dependent methyltransferase
MQNFFQQLQREQSYYENFSEDYAIRTWQADMSDQLKRFSRYLPTDARILDVGSGSGRDTLGLLAMGYSVEAIDASPAMAQESFRRTGVVTRVDRIEVMEVSEPYDGIWLCAVLPHVRRELQGEAWCRVRLALKSSGFCYASYKVGDSTRVDGFGRYFFDVNEESCNRIVETAGLTVVEQWRSQSAIQDQCEWLNTIVRPTCD